MRSPPHSPVDATGGAGAINLRGSSERHALIAREADRERRDGPLALQRVRVGGSGETDDERRGSENRESVHVMRTTRAL